MQAVITDVLNEFHARHAAEERHHGTISHTQRQAERDDFLFPIGPEVGALLNVLIKGRDSKTIIEIGTSYGYSTIWLAEAARAVDSKVISLDHDASKQEYAAEALVRAGLRDWVEFKTGDAAETLANLPDSFDFVLLDVWKEFYIPCFDAIYPKLNDGALIVADNMLLPPELREQGKLYRAHIRSFAGIESMLLDLGMGVELTRYLRDTV